MKKIFAVLSILTVVSLSGCGNNGNNIVATSTPIATSTPTAVPTTAPTIAPTAKPTPVPTIAPTKAPTRTEDYLSLEKFNKIQTGMSYAKVVNIIGIEGTLISTSEIMGITTSVYGWYGEYGVPAVSIVLQDNAVMSKSQIGLK